MEKLVDYPDISLLSWVISFIKHSDLSVTVQYGYIILRDNERTIALELDRKLEEYELFYSDNLSAKLNEQVFVLFIPLTKLTNVNKLESIIECIFDFEKIDYSVHPIISIPFEYYQILVTNGSLYLDKFFVITNTEKYYKYKVYKKCGKDYFDIIQGNFVSSFRCRFTLRSGIGNTNL